MDSLTTVKWIPEKLTLLGAETAPVEANSKNSKIAQYGLLRRKGKMGDTVEARLESPE